MVLHSSFLFDVFFAGVTQAALTLGLTAATALLSVLLSICKIVVTHPQNKLHKGGIYLFDDHSGIRYPDFYKDDMVLDAKYKRLGSYDKVSKVGGDDLHQVIAYLSPLHATRGGFVAPLEHKQEKVPTSHLKGKDATLSIFGIEISKNASSYADFCNHMQAMETTFVESLKL